MVQPQLFCQLNQASLAHQSKSADICTQELQVSANSTPNRHHFGSERFRSILSHFISFPVFPSVTLEELTSLLQVEAAEKQ